MSFTLKDLPYAQDALEPAISKETLQYHWGKHHQTYVNKLNGLVQNTDLASKSLEELITQEDGGIYNNAAQIWNHDFYWQSLTPTPHAIPEKLAHKINESFDSIENFTQQFKN